MSSRSAKTVSGQKFPGAIFVRDIAGYKQEFQALFVSLDSFLRKISGERRFFPEALETAPNPPTLDSIKRMIYGHLSTTQQSK